MRLLGRWSWWAAALALTLLMILLATLAWLWVADQRRAEERRQSLDLLWLEQTLKERLDSDAKLLLNWAHDLAPPLPAATAEFSQRSSGWMKDRSGLLALDLIDDAGRRLLSVPESPQRAASLPPLSDPLIAAAVARAHTLAQPAYSRVIEQGAPLWVLAVPVVEDGVHHGSLLATYDLERLLEQEVPWWFVQRYDLQLVDTNDKRLSPRDPVATESETPPQRLHFGPEDSGLQLRISPHASDEPRPLLLALSIALALFATLVAWLLRVLARWLRDRQQAQQALADSRAQLYAVLSGMGTAVSVSAAEGARLLFRNPQHEALFPLTPEGDCCLLPPLRAPAEGPALEFVEALSGRCFLLERRPIRWVDGATVWLDSASDVTAQHRAAQTARERDELLQQTGRLASLAEFASGIAHELNQPLAAMANYAAVAEAQLDHLPGATPPLSAAVRGIGNEAQRAGQIIQSLRAFIHKRSVVRRRTPLGALLAEPLALLAPLAQRLHCEIQLDGVADEALVIEGDTVMLEQVLLNLLRNALEAVAARETPAPPDAVQVRLWAEPGAVLACVSDRGGGVAEPERLFQAFFSTKPGGMGLGLAICRTVIESHGGRLWHEPQPGGGSRFLFRLPQATDNPGP